MSCAKTAEPNELPFGRGADSCGSKELWGSGSPTERGTFEGTCAGAWLSTVTYLRTVNVRASRRQEFVSRAVTLRDRDISLVQFKRLLKTLLFVYGCGAQ